MDASVQGALRNFKKCWKDFEHNEKPMTEKQVWDCLQYANKKGYTRVSQLTDEEIESIINPQKKVEK